MRPWLTLSLISAALLMAPGCATLMTSGTPIVQYERGKDPVLQEAPSDGEYALYSKFDTTPKVTFALRQGEPLGFKPSTTGKVTAVAGGREKDFPDGNYVWKRR